MKIFKQIAFLVIIIISMANFAKAEQRNKNHRHHHHGPSIQFRFGGAPFMFFNSGPRPYYYNQNIYPHPFLPRNSYGVQGSRLGLNAWWGTTIIERGAIRQKRRKRKARQRK